MDAVWQIAIGLGAACLLFGAALALRAYLYRLVDRRIAAYQNELMARHCEEVTGIYRQMRGWRHDYHNHIQTLKAYRAMREDARIDGYLDRLDADLTGVDKLIKSGNVMVDAILNSKLSLAAGRGVRVHAKAVVPAELAIADIDLCVIVGNLLDNAMEAATQVADGIGRFIRVYIDVKRDQLYISVTNATAGRPRKARGQYMSRKGEGHGFGLARVDRIVDKYEGYAKRNDEEGAFTTEVLLPL